MRFRFTNDQLEFAAALRELLQREFTTADLRQVWERGDGHDGVLWERLAEMGVLGMMVPESDGGIGGDLVDTILLVEELGRAAVPGPVVETMTVAAAALAGTDRSKRIATGELTATAALMGETLVPHPAADVTLLAVDGELFAVDGDELSTAPIEGLDRGRLIGELLAAPAGGTALDAELAVIVDIGAAATAGYLLGLSSQMIDMAAGYARNRHQFGQPIGSFQAVKHLMANALLQVEFARPAVHHAAWSLATAQPTHTRDASMAKCLASEAAQQAARAALQVHGAIGYTWECDLHMFMKKAWALAPAWGGPGHHRRIVADAVLGRAALQR